MTTGTTGAKTIIHPVQDLDAAKAFYGALLGQSPSMDAPYYVQYDVAGQEVGLDPNGAAKGLTGPLNYWHVDDVRASVEALVAAGGTVREDVHDVGGRLIATVVDQDGNALGLLQPA
jgi:predicted enzyme related to lactoylglutathione lyase